MNNRFGGFSLIELVIVIVVLGILAVSAVPKFVGMQSDARVATLNSMKGSLKSANNMVYAKALFNGANTNYSEKELGTDWSEECKENNCVEVNGVWVYFKYAYLDRNSIAFVLDGDISGKTTAKDKNGRTIPNRCTREGCLNKTCNSYNASAVCTGHDFCQCRSEKKDESCKKVKVVVNGQEKNLEICTDSQFLIPRGMPYKNSKCYLKYTSAEITTGKVPLYKIETSGC